MPIFQDDFEQELRPPDVPPSEPISIQQTPARLARRLSEESIRTELCEGPVPDSPPHAPPKTPEQEPSTEVSDRAELIERLKRGESPTWVPNRHVSCRPTTEAVGRRANPRDNQLLHHQTRSPKRSDSPTLLPPATITPEKPETTLDEESRLQEGLNIERPRSALHSGDFRQDESTGEHASQTEGREGGETQGFSQTAQPMSWMSTSPPRDFNLFSFERRLSFTTPKDRSNSGLSSLSSSVSSSFVYKPPTSPLVQSETNDDADVSAADAARQHAMMKQQQSPFSFSSPIGSSQRRLPIHRREGSLPYQAHQPRRSLTSSQSLQIPGSSPQTPAFVRSRRPSFSSDTSPLQHASMVGSYEESILRGRMSTTPSRPLEFLAQIGVLGIGKCKPSLRCPPHVNLSFPAVFYSYATTSHGRTKVEDGPSPYVGQIDLENGLPNQEEVLRARRKMQSRQLDRERQRSPELEGANMDASGENQNHGDGSDIDSRKQLKQRRRSRSPRAPPGGSYRIPERGQLQIVIKNLNKTAVKLFLVPYDLTGMEPGTRTFIRQRSYSTGPIIDNVPMIEDATRPTLRYLVHLNICCPSRGRYYLYKDIRVVFANRVPDGKEKLRNEITFPEPRYSPYKATRTMHPPLTASQTSSVGAMLAAEKEFRRRSYGFSFRSSARAFDSTDGVPQSLYANGGLNRAFTQMEPLPFGSGGGSGNAPVDPIPHQLPTRSDARNQGDLGEPSVTMRSPSDSVAKDSADGDPRLQAMASSPASPSSPDFGRYDKLSKGDVGYGGNAFALPLLGSGSPGTAAESLLSQRLRSLGVDQSLRQQGHHQQQQQQEQQHAESDEAMF